MTAPTPLIAGNWKMNGLGADLEEAAAMAAGVGETAARLALCPPATLLERMARTLAGSPILLGGQDCSPQAGRAFTGDVSVAMLADAGPPLPLLGPPPPRARQRALHGK